MSDDARQLPLHEVEREQARRGPEIQRLWLQAQVVQRGTGDVGPAVEVVAVDGSEEGALPPYRRLDPSHPHTLFGEITVDRTSYCRRGKGERAQQTKMAVVATVYTQPPRTRTPQEVFEHWFGLAPPPPRVTRDAAPPRARPEYTRVWASRLKGRVGIMAEVIQEIRQRDPQQQKSWVVRTDGERALPQSVKRRLRGVPLGLDFPHVLAKLWGAAYAFDEEGSLKAVAWVQEQAWRLRHGEASQVVQGMRLSATKRQLRGQKRKAVAAIASYVYRNRRHMRDDEHLQQGSAIATGVVEGACKSLIKDWRERSGMRWTPTMAEAMRKLGAVYLSGDCEVYWAFFVAREHQRFHPPGSWRPLHSIEEK